MPLPGDCWAPSAFFFVPPRQPTAATTAPGLAFASPAVCAFAGPCTTTSVTMFARKQSFTVGALPLQSGVPSGWFLPVGRFTLSKLAPPSLERKRPAPVAAYTSFALFGSTTILKPSTPSGTPLECFQVLPSEVERYTPRPAYVSPPNALSPVSTNRVPPPALDHARPETPCVGRLSAIEVQEPALSVDFQMPPFDTAA